VAATFTQALKAAYDAIAVPSGHTDLPAFWSEQIAPNITTYPRADFMHGGETPAWNKDGVVKRIDAHGQLCFYATSLASAEQLADDAADGLTPDSLSIDDKRNRLWPPTKRLAIAQERTTDQRPVFMAILEYHCEISV
jgi:hypothetical protein